jgi:putative component of toxin-antitoxin plasmid stabilization module
VYKIRVRDSSLTRGKGSGYRLYYAVSERHRKVLLLWMHHKKDVESTDWREVSKLIEGSESVLDPSPKPSS